MNSTILTGLSLLLFYLGYKFYSKYISGKNYTINDNQKTPSHEFKDAIIYRWNNQLKYMVTNDK